MKRILSLALFGIAAALLGGCPIYPDSNDYRVCDGNACYDCPNNYHTDACSPWACESTPDCPGGYWCSQGSCVGPGSGVGYDAGIATDATAPTACSGPDQCPPGYSCGSDGQCDLGPCSVTGCVAGYVCELLGGTLQCVPQTVPPVDASVPDAAVACQTNGDCASTPGALCLDGVCVPPVDQCYDGTQCPAGDRCVQGACTPSCTPSADGGAGGGCPTGYSCSVVGDASSGGVCSGNPEPCSKDPSVCPSGTVCSQDHCVAACGPGGTCPTGEQCVQGGCVPNQSPQFFCTSDGVQSACASGSICLHHFCYIACNPEAGAAACQSADQFNECKSVTTSSGTYDVCGSSTNLGSECSPTTPCASSAAVCIDGYCH